MKYILMSIKKKYSDLIFSGKKTLEVRTTLPNEELPVKVLMYETLGEYNSLTNSYEGSGKVVGEFVLSKFERIDFVDGQYCITARNLSETCLTNDELMSYGKGRTLYGWNTTNELCRYRAPKELADFDLKRPPQSWMYLTKTAIKKSNII